MTRSVRWPGCYDFYTLQETGRIADATALQQARCASIKDIKPDYFIYPANFFKLRDVTLTIPLGRLIPRTSSSSLVFSAQNIFRRNDGMPMFDPEMSDNGGFNTTVRAINEHIPAPAVFLSSLRISF